LRHNGMLFLSSPHCPIREHSGNPFHVKEYQPNEIRSLVEPYYEIIDVTKRRVGDVEVNYFQSRVLKK
jgi:hypothetical protein